jgi:hypothetical protein
MRLVKDLDIGVNGFDSYDYFTFTSETTTRSGYDVTRRHYAAGRFIFISVLAISMTSCFVFLLQPR